MRSLRIRLGSLVLAALVAVAAGAVPAHASTVGEVIDDTRISAEVKAKLTAESPSNFLKIDVTTQQGIVTLSGTVASVDPAAGIVTLTDGRVLKVGTGTMIWQPTSLRDVQPGALVTIRGAAHADAPAPSASPR